MGIQAFLNKTAVLRKYEIYGYRNAFYLLGNETLATEAAKEALAELYRMDEFYRLPADRQREIVKRVFIKFSLSVKAAALA